jgi:hypothetical protein
MGGYEGRGVPLGVSRGESVSSRCRGFLDSFLL